MPDYKWLQIEAEAETVFLTLHRPGDRNSLNSQVMEELGRALEEIEAGPPRAVIVTGGGDEYFIGGADGIEMMQCSPREAFDFSRRFQALLDRFEASPLITLAAVNGLCFGGGFELALACDLRVAAESARLGLPEVKVGLIPGGGGTQRLPALVGKGLALEMILSGRLYPGPEAARLGLVNRCVARDKLRETALGLLAPILMRPSHAVAHAKAAVQAWPCSTLPQGLARESREFSRCFEHDFFVNLMKEQLKSGVLKTTASLPEGFPGKD